MSKWIRLFVISLLLLSITPFVLAQDTISEGDTIEGEESDDITEYEIELEKGAVIEISIEADWDTYLEVYDDNGNMLASDDDGGNGTLSLLVFAAPNNDNFFIRVRAFGGDTPTGDYELTVEAVQVTRLIDAGELEYGDDEDVEADNTLAIEATFDGTAGDVVNITTVSENFLSTTMTLIDPQGEEVAESDNTYGDSEIHRVELEEDGTYTIRIEGLEGSVLDGDIELELDLAETNSSEIISLDDGEVTIDGEESNDITEYEIELDEGAVIEISIDADWDTYLEIYDDNGNMLASDDDGGNGTLSRLVFSVPNSDNYFIRVRAFGGDTPTGDYELTVEAIEVTQFIDAGELEYGDDEDVDADDALAIEATFEGTAGDIVDIITRSDNYLTTRMTLLDEQDNEVAESENYYGDALIRRIELEETGTYTIRIEELEGGILDGDIEIEVSLTEIITMDDGAVNFEIGDGDDIQFVNFTAIEDMVYELTIVFDDEPTYSDVSLYVLEEGQNLQDYSELTISMRGGRGFSYVFEADDDGEFVIRVEYYGNDDIEVTMSIEEIEE